MHIGKKYTFYEYIQWTKKESIGLVLWSSIATALYAIFDWQFLSIPWTIVAILGTTLSFIIGFKNVECHKRVSNALDLWNLINSRSFAWGNMVMGYIYDKNSPEETHKIHQILFSQHYAWLTILRYQLRESTTWENLDDPGTRKFMAYYTIPEKQSKLSDELAKYLPEPTLTEVLEYKGDRANYVLSLQSKIMAESYRKKIIDPGPIYATIQTMLTELIELQGCVQRIKFYPYARNFYSIALILLRMFILLVPFAMLSQFHELGQYMNMEKWTVWANIPFSVMVTWIFVTLEKVGEASSNPFEGNANDVPISTISKTIELEMRRMLGEVDLPSPEPTNNIVIL